MDPDPDPGGPKHVDPVDPHSDPDPEHWLEADELLNMNGYAYTYVTNVCH